MSILAVSLLTAACHGATGPPGIQGTLLFRFTAGALFTNTPLPSPTPHSGVVQVAQPPLVLKTIQVRSDGYFLAHVNPGLYVVSAYIPGVTGGSPTEPALRVHEDVTVQHHGLTTVRLIVWEELP